MTDSTNALVEVRQVRQQIAEAQASRDVSAANAGYAKELDLLRQQAVQQQERTPSTTHGVDDYLYHTGLITTDELRALGELEGDEDVIALSELVGTAVREFVSTERFARVTARRRNWRGPL